MKATGWWLFLGLAGFPGVAAADSGPRMSVLVYNYAGVAQPVLDGARRETSRIYGLAGIEIRWVDCPVLAGQEPVPAACGDTRGPRSHELRLLRRGVALPGVGSAALGCTLYPKQGGPGILANVFVDRATRLAAARSMSEAVVLGHVMAHEVGHLLLGRGNHSTGGLMHDPWADQELKWAAQGALVLLPQQADVIRWKLSAWTTLPQLSAAPGTPRWDSTAAAR